MLPKVRWLAVVGTIVLALGLYLALARQAQLYLGLVLVAGCICWSAVLLINEPS